MRQDALLKEYKTFCTHFQTICVAAGHVVRPTDGSSIQVERTGDYLNIKTLFYFPDWPYKAASTKKIEILVRSQEKYRSADDLICASSVQVLYLRHSSVQTEAKCLLALHYDFELPVQSAHPVFHAQLGMSDFSRNELEAVGFRWTIDKPEDPHYSSVRIPTACMNFQSVLLGIAADHLKANFFIQIFKLVKNSRLATWNAHCVSLKQSMSNGRYLPSNHWYEGR